MSKTSKIRLLILVYRIYVKDIKDFPMYMYLFQKDDPDKYKTWFELGVDIGLEIVDDEEVEAEVDQIEAGEEVECTKTPKSIIGK